MRNCALPFRRVPHRPALRRHVRLDLPHEITMSGDHASLLAAFTDMIVNARRLADGRSILDDVRRRRLPIGGGGSGVWSFIHIDDAAAATSAALDRGAPGVYNIVDDDPARVAEWLPAAAQAVGAPPPRHVPRWLGRLFAGEVGVVMMTEVRGASNEKAKRELGWRPRHPSWREGFGERAAA